MSQEIEDTRDLGNRGREPDSKPRIPLLVVGAVVLAALIAAGLYATFGGRTASSPDDPRFSIDREAIPEAPARPLPPAGTRPTPRTAPTAASPDTAATAPVETSPSLDASDDVVRPGIAALSTHPSFASWLIPKNLVRRFVVSVVNLAQQKSPRHHLGFMKPAPDFSVEEAGELFRIQPDSYARYDLIADVFTSIDVSGAADLYFTESEFIREAYIELGYPERRFHDTLTAAITHLLETPIIHGEPEYELLIVTYGYADMRLEALSKAQKQFLRMGPENVRRIQIKLRLLAHALGIPSETLPSLRVHIPDSKWYDLEAAPDS